MTLWQLRIHLRLHYRLWDLSELEALCQETWLPSKLLQDN